MISPFKQLAVLPLLPLGKCKQVYYGCRLALHRDERLIENLKLNHLVPVLSLHRVSPEKDHQWGSLNPSLFDELIGYLKKKFRLVTFEELRRGGNPAEELPPLVLSFDDGFVDFLEYAVPILDKHQVRVNMNIIPKYCETGNLPWNFVLYDFLQRAPSSLIREIRLPGFAISSNLFSTRQKIQFGLAISAYFKNRSCAERNELWKQVEVLLDKWGQRPQFRMLNTKEIRGLATIHEFGAHSYGHDSMAFETMEFFERDFALCRKYFGEQLGLPTKVYAFPNGSYRDEQVEKLLQLGIEHVLLVNDKFTLPRNRVHNRFTIFGESLGELVFRSLGG